jgi:predicted RNA binding protein YcfA (HicA-like mRNA interferase family)
MSKFPRNIKPLKLIKALQKAGFIEDGGRGSHVHLSHPDGRWTQVAVHAKPIPVGTLHAILRQAEISVEALLEFI